MDAQRCENTLKRLKQVFSFREASKTKKTVQLYHSLSCLTMFTDHNYYRLSVGRFFLDRALYAIVFSVLDIGVIYLWPWVKFPNTEWQSSALSSNEIAFQQDSAALLLCLVTNKSQCNQTHSISLTENYANSVSIILILNYQPVCGKCVIHPLFVLYLFCSTPATVVRIVNSQ